MAKDRKACNGKRKHKTYKDARIELHASSHTALNIYECPKCGYYHVGRSSRPDMIIRRIDQLLMEANK